MDFEILKTFLQNNHYFRDWAFLNIKTAIKIGGVRRPMLLVQECKQLSKFSVLQRVQNVSSVNCFCLILLRCFDSDYAHIIILSTNSRPAFTAKGKKYSGGGTRALLTSVGRRPLSASVVAYIINIRNRINFIFIKLFYGIRQRQNNLTKHIKNINKFSK